MTKVINDAGALVEDMGDIASYYSFIHNANGQWGCNVSTTWFSGRTRTEGSLEINGPSFAIAAANAMDVSVRSSISFPNTNQMYHQAGVTLLNIGDGNNNSRGVFNFEIVKDDTASMMFLEGAGPNFFLSLTARFANTSITFQNITGQVHPGTVILKAWRS